VLLTPCLLYTLWPPAVRDTAAGPAAAAARLQQMGPLSTDERIKVGAVAVAVLLWVFGAPLGVEPVTASLLAVCILLATGVLQWSDCLAYNAPWDTLVWFTGVRVCVCVCACACVLQGWQPAGMWRP
jgi:DASS family divalent anion:Na+ symporter